MKTLTLPDRETWLEARRQGLGGSDAAAVLGLSPFTSPLQLFAEKLGLVEPEPESERMYWGRILEPAIADRYAEETKRTLAPAAPYTLSIGERDWMRATLDRVITAADGKDVPAALEIKSTSAFRADDWLEEPPVHVQIQGQHQLLVTGHAWVSFAVLIGGQTFRYCDVPRNDKFIAVLRDRLAEFWRRLELKDPPPAGAEDKEVLAMLFPKDDGTEITLPDEAMQWDIVRTEAIANVKTWSKARDEAENKLRAALGEASSGRLLSGARFSLKQQTTNYPAREASSSTFRVLRRHDK